VNIVYSLIFFHQIGEAAGNLLDHFNKLAHQNSFFGYFGKSTIIAMNFYATFHIILHGFFFFFLSKKKKSHLK